MNGNLFVINISNTFMIMLHYPHSGKEEWNFHIQIEWRKPNGKLEINYEREAMMEELKKKKEDNKILFFMLGVIAFVPISMIIVYCIVINIYPGIWGDGTIQYNGETYVEIGDYRWNVIDEEEGKEIEVYISETKERYSAILYGNSKNTCIYLNDNGELY